MSKKDKHFDPKKEPKKEKEPVQEESQESKLAKKIIDLEAMIAAKDKEIENRNKVIDAMKHDLNAMAQEYKNQIILKMDEANRLIKIKQDENDQKYKKELAEAKKYAIENQAIELIDIVAEFSAMVNHPVNDPKIAN
ncbi:MAG: hypothetical protein MJ233_03910 [Mycoplasmoidaceae bacterium]|nr:hypothetical protein [Mycoplasmoidaceae bacterium]